MSRCREIKRISGRVMTAVLVLAACLLFGMMGRMTNAGEQEVQIEINAEGNEDRTESEDFVPEIVIYSSSETGDMTPVWGIVFLGGCSLVFCVLEIARKLRE